ncbi:hypothetical protein [Methylobacterium aquaticum]|uniref:Uncharacterized protein n=2 Tax=Methylobacterium aquaticum TaxID=270351 RepID=A0A0J6S3V0_9HYPH|nr:hypothetical protein [Methylobacterium aquaticum]KMO28272.1 hypothetical protein VP06_28205 [Methylobacterium aquaticum]
MMIRSNALRAGLVLLALLAGLLTASPMVVTGILTALGLAGAVALAGARAQQAPALVPVRVRDRRRR